MEGGDVTLLSNQPGEIKCRRHWIDLNQDLACAVTLTVSTKSKRLIQSNLEKVGTIDWGRRTLIIFSYQISLSQKEAFSLNPPPYACGHQVCTVYNPTERDTHWFREPATMILSVTLEVDPLPMQRNSCKNAESVFPLTTAYWYT